MNPNTLHSTKRGLINPIGTIYKLAFGLLDSEDGEKLYPAIDKLKVNQKHIHKALNKPISLSKLLIDRLNNILTIISNNQINLANSDFATKTRPTHCQFH